MFPTSVPCCYRWAWTTGSVQPSVAPLRVVYSKSGSNLVAALVAALADTAQGRSAAVNVAGLNYLRARQAVREVLTNLLDEIDMLVAALLGPAGSVAMKNPPHMQARDRGAA